MERSQEFYRAGTANDLKSDDISDKIEKELWNIYTSGKFECNEDDLKHIPEVLESLNEQWQKFTTQSDLISERFQKKIVRTVKGPGQVSRAEALPHLSRPPQQRSSAKAPPQGAAEGIGTGHDGGDDGAGNGCVGADAGPGRVAQGAPAPQMQQPSQPRAAAAGGEGGSRSVGERAPAIGDRVQMIFTDGNSTSWYTGTITNDAGDEKKNEKCTVKFEDGDEQRTNVIGDPDVSWGRGAGGSGSTRNGEMCRKAGGSPVNDAGG